MNPTQLVIFDLDGTLFDPTDVIIKALYRAIDAAEKQFGIDIKYPNRAEILKLVGEVDYKFVEDLELGLSKEQAEYLRSALWENQTQMIENGEAKLYSGASEAIKAISDLGLQLAIATNAARNYLLATLDTYDLNQYIDFSICNEDIGLGDKIELLREVLQNQEMMPSEVVYVADRESDFLVARALQIKSIGCTWGFGSPEELTLADCAVDSFAELVDLLK